MLMVTGPTSTWDLPKKDFKWFLPVPNTNYLQTMDELTIRQALAEDKHDIFAINDNVYGGNDYLRAYFNHFMTASNITSYVAVIAEKIVGYVVADVVDEGATVLTRAARTKPTLSGRGIYSSLTNHVMKMTSAKTVAFTKTDINPALQTSSFKNAHRQILARNIICLSVDLHSINLPAKSTTETDLTTPSTDDIGHMMSSKLQRKYLFPNNRIVVDWVPYKLLPSNIPYFSHTGAVTRIVTNALNGFVESKGLMSISTLYKCKTPKFAIILDIYGTDRKCLKDYLLFHFRHICAITDSKITLPIVFEQSIDVKLVIEMIKEIGVRESNINHDFFSQLDGLLVFEKDV